MPLECLSSHTFIEKYIQALQSGKIAYINHGHSLTCPTYIGNLMDAVYLAAYHPAAVNEAFIITDGLDINWQQFTENITDKMGLKKPKLSIPLGFEPQYDFEDAMTATIEWFKEKYR